MSRMLSLEETWVEMVRFTLEWSPEQAYELIKEIDVNLLYKHLKERGASKEILERANELWYPKI